MGVEGGAGVSAGADPPRGRFLMEHTRATNSLYFVRDASWHYTKKRYAQ